MTLHILTITPNHVICVSDRLISTSTGYTELDNDKYKHLLLTTNDARVSISFAGFAGILGKNSELNETTIDWLTQVIQNTSKAGYHDINKHLIDIRDCIQNHIDRLAKLRIPSKDLRLALLISGWIGSEQFGCVIDNCLEKAWTWSSEARTSFKVRVRNYSNAKFEDGSYISFLGNERLAMRQRALIKVLELHARNEEPKNIFNASVNIIRAVAELSDGTVGINCSGIRMSRNDPGIEIYDDRDTQIFDFVMPNCIQSTSRISVSVTNMKGHKGLDTNQP